MKKKYSNEIRNYEVEIWDKQSGKHVFSRSFGTLREARFFIARMNRMAVEYRLQNVTLK